MNSEIKQKWVEALRSGKYKQGRWRLRDGDTFCCLGVLCDIIAPNGWVGLKHQGEVKMPSALVEREAGIFRGAGTLAELNDSGASFARIADYIESNF